MARDEGWLAEHMLILKIIPPGDGGTAEPVKLDETSGGLIYPCVLLRLV
jgi:hypothetical protein